MSIRIAARLLSPVLTAPGAQRARLPEPKRLAGVRTEGVPQARQRPGFYGEVCAEIST